MIHKLKKEKCTGCGACYNACPIKCIKMKPDEKGFFYPDVDMEKCIKCGRCDNICPSQHNVQHMENAMVPEVWAAWSLDEDIRYESTSGGVFSELALCMLNESGIVCGAKYNENNLVEHCIIHNVEGLKKLRQSKYVQSETKLIYTEIRELLEQGRKVMFCGTPCECAGLQKILGNDYGNILYVDFICRGANSPKVYQLFLESLERKYKSKVKRVWFKNKELGWRKFSTRVEFENGEVYSQDRYSDSFIRGYIEANLYMRDCCEKCQYKQMPRISDITLGDFWGIKSEDVGADTDLGTSLIMLNSKKGAEFFEKIKSRLFINKRSFEEAYKGNKCILLSPKFNEDRKLFWADIDSMDVIDNIKRFCKK